MYSFVHPSPAVPGAGAAGRPACVLDSRIQLPRRPQHTAGPCDYSPHQGTRDTLTSVPQPCPTTTSGWARASREGRSGSDRGSSHHQGEACAGDRAGEEEANRAPSSQRLHSAVGGGRKTNMQDVKWRVASAESNASKQGSQMEEMETWCALLSGGDSS